METPAHQIDEQYHQAAGSAKLASCFLEASNKGRSPTQLGMAKKNLKIALDAITTIENINALKHQ